MNKQLTNQKNNSLLSLNLIDGKNDREILKKIYSVSNNIEKHYHTFKIKKRKGGHREINEPSKILKSIQKNILHNILEKMPVSHYAKAYTPGLSLVDNASVHTNKKIVLKLDIENYFNNITFVKIYNILSSLNLPKSTIYLLSTLCTYEDILPQGAPTSSYLSNLVMYETDEVIGNYCKENNISYTRYSDDMTFSGDFDVNKLIVFVNNEIHKINLKLNKAKTRVISKNKCQKITGIVVNEKVQVSSSYRKKIRQEVYFINKFGVENHLNKLNLNINRNKYLKSLLGRINFVLSVNPIDNEFMNYKNNILELVRG